MEDVFKLFVENMNSPVWIKDLNDKFIFSNQMFADIYNKKVEDIVGKKLEDFIQPHMLKMFNEHTKMVIDSGEAITRELYAATGYRQCTVTPLKDKNGEIKYLAGRVGVLTESGKIKAKDNEIEIQKMLTEKIIDILPGTIFYKDIDGRYVYANKTCREFHIRRGQGSIIGKTDKEINFSTAQQEKFVRDDQIILTTKKPIYNEAVFTNPDGSLMYNEVVKLPLEDNHGNIVGIVGRVLDVTEKKRNQERLEFLSYTDLLTGVKNRASFEVRQVELSKEEYSPLGLIMGDANGLKLINDTFGHLHGDNLLIHIAKILKEICADKGEVFRFGGDEFIILVPNTSIKECEDMILEINNRCQQNNNQVYKISISLGSSVQNNPEKDTYDLLQEAEDKVYRQKLLQNQSIKSSILNSLKIGFGVSSGETEHHTERVSINAVKVGKHLKLEMSQIDEITIAADLHDIGKIGISEEILLKPDALTEDEYEVMKTHCEKGYRIIKASSELRNVAESVLYHHERWDGTGYPMGLKEDGIPLLARIISVCDAYDVMINDRVYNKAISKEAAIEELKRCAGTQFDHRVVQAFIECI